MLLLVIPLPCWGCVTQGEDSLQSEFCAVGQFFEEFFGEGLGELGEKIGHSQSGIL